MKKIVAHIFLLIVVGFAGLSGCNGQVVQENQKTFLIDRTGERWDISQAVSLGFDPDDFEFGLGRNAFTPLNDAMMTPGKDVRHSTRVLGIASGDQEAKAYSVNKLSGHEIANSSIGKNPVAAAY